MWTEEWRPLIEGRPASQVTALSTIAGCWSATENLPVCCDGCDGPCQANLIRVPASGPLLGLDDAVSAAKS